MFDHDHIDRFITISRLLNLPISNEMIINNSSLMYYLIKVFHFYLYFLIKYVRSTVDM